MGEAFRHDPIGEAGAPATARTAPPAALGIVVTVSTKPVAGGTPGDDATRPAARGEPPPPARDGRNGGSAPAVGDTRDELRRAAARLSLIHEIDRAILAAESTSEIADRVVERLRQLAGADRVAVSAIDTARGILTVLAFSQDAEAGGFTPGMEVPLEGLVEPRILEAHEIVVYRDLVASAVDRPGLRSAADVGYRAAVLVPLLAGGRLVGLLSLAGHDQGVASDDNVAIATEVAAQLAIAIDHATARERLERSHARLALVYEIDGAILAAATPAEVAGAVADRLVPLLGADSVGVAAYAGGRRTMLAIAGLGAERIRELMRSGGPRRPRKRAAATGPRGHGVRADRGRARGDARGAAHDRDGADARDDRAARGRGRRGGLAGAGRAGPAADRAGDRGDRPGGRATSSRSRSSRRDAGRPWSGPRCASSWSTRSTRGSSGRSRPRISRRGSRGRCSASRAPGGSTSRPTTWRATRAGSWASPTTTPAR